MMRRGDYGFISTHMDWCTGWEISIQIDTLRRSDHRKGQIGSQHTNVQHINRNNGPLFC